MPQRTMPTTDPAMTKVKKMNKIGVNSLSAKSVLAREKLIATYSIST
jgi:hypothetical protein